MKQLLSIAALFTIAFTSCSKHSIKGEGSTTSETRNVQAFQTVEANGSTNVTVYPSATDYVIVTGYENLIPVYETKVNNGRLILQFKDNYINVRNSNIHVSVYSTQVSRIKINGSGDISVQPAQVSKYMNLEVNGSGEISFGDNQFNVVNCDVNGSGNINGVACHADTLNAKISGSGNIKMNVAKLLSVRISGSGNVDYWGRPVISDVDISGSGKINKH